VVRKESQRDSEELIKSIGQIVRNNRKSQVISQSQLAFEAGIPREQIGRIERGEINTTIRTLNSIAKALNVSIDEFFK
jgi:transcriptional regulator with XRE-family HTH domain